MEASQLDSSKLKDPAKGDERIGDPVEYDNLKLVLTDSTVEITVFNRGITLLMSDDEQVRRIHRILSSLGELRTD